MNLCTPWVRFQFPFPTQSNKQIAILSRYHNVLLQVLHQREGRELFFPKQFLQRFVANDHALVVGVLQVLFLTRRENEHVLLEIAPEELHKLWNHVLYSLVPAVATSSPFPRMPPSRPTALAPS